jgi:hypothetical protein
MLAATCLASVFFTGACRQSPAEAEGFTGTWVMTLGDRTLMVLTLSPSSDGFSGSLQRPTKMNTDGQSFSGLGGGVTTEPVSKASRQGEALNIVLVNPKDPNDQTELEAVLTAVDRLSLRYVGMLVGPFSFRRFRTGPPAVSTDWESERSYDLETPFEASNRELRAMAEEDQAARKKELSSDEKHALVMQDAERRARTLALLNKGELRSAEDYRNAALIFQHGSAPKDFLLAHTLATVALAKKDASASWLAAATLDRYLRSVGQPQIYGTQFNPGKVLNQQPFDQGLVPDSVREKLRVPPLAEQIKQFEALQAGQRP